MCAVQAILVPYIISVLLSIISNFAIDQNKIQCHITERHIDLSHHDKQPSEV